MQMTLKDYKLLAFLLVVALLAVASFDNQNASGMGILTQARDAESNRREAQAAAAREERVLAQAKNSANRLVWLDNYQAAIKESKATGKPIFLEFRCGP